MPREREERGLKAIGSTAIHPGSAPMPLPAAVIAAVTSAGAVSCAVWLLLPLCSCLFLGGCRWDMLPGIETDRSGLLCRVLKGLFNAEMCMDAVQCDDLTEPGRMFMNAGEQELRLTYY